MQGKTQGVEINPVQFLMWDSEEKTLAGTYSRFLVDKKVELAFPFMWTSTEHDVSYSSYDTDVDGESATSFTLDMHYRKFLGRRMHGFYISGFVRGASLNGSLEDSTGGSSHSEFKVGGGFGVGYRYFSTENFYWGTSISVGKYLVGDSNIYADTDSLSFDADDSEAIVDIEFFKFGYAF